MLYLALFILKLVYTVWYVLRIILQFLYKFSVDDINWTAETLNPKYHESDGYYCKNIVDMWAGRYQQSDEVKQNWENNIDYP